MDVAPTGGSSEVAEGTGKDKERDTDTDKDSEAGCLMGQLRAKEQRPKDSRGES